MITGVVLPPRGSRRRHVRIGRAQRSQPGEPLGVPVLGQDVDQAPPARRRRGQPPQRRPDEIGADRHEQRPVERVVVPPVGVAVLAQPPDRDLPPAPPAGVGTAEQPSVLPGLARLGAQPVQQQPDASLVDAPVAATRALRRERRAGQPRPDRVSLLPRDRPTLPRRAREGSSMTRGRLGRLGCVDDGDDYRAHDGLGPPNRTASVSGR